MGHSPCDTRGELLSENPGSVLWWRLQGPRCTQAWPVAPTGSPQPWPLSPRHVARWADGGGCLAWSDSQCCPLPAVTGPLVCSLQRLSFVTFSSSLVRERNSSECCLFFLFFNPASSRVLASFHSLRTEDPEDLSGTQLHPRPLQSVRGNMPAARGPGACPPVLLQPAEGRCVGVGVAARGFTRSPRHARVCACS